MASSGDSKASNLQRDFDMDGLKIKIEEMAQANNQAMLSLHDKFANQLYEAKKELQQKPSGVERSMEAWRWNAQFQKLVRQVNDLERKAGTGVVDGKAILKPISKPALPANFDDIVRVAVETRVQAEVQQLVAEQNEQLEKFVTRMEAVNKQRALQEVVPPKSSDRGFLPPVEEELSIQADTAGMLNQMQKQMEQHDVAFENVKNEMKLQSSRNDDMVAKLSKSVENQAAELVVVRSEVKATLDENDVRFEQLNWQIDHKAQEASAMKQELLDSISKVDAAQQETSRKIEATQQEASHSSNGEIASEEASISSWKDREVPVVTRSMDFAEGVYTDVEKMVDRVISKQQDGVAEDSSDGLSISDSDGIIEGDDYETTMKNMVNAWDNQFADLINYVEDKVQEQKTVSADLSESMRATQETQLLLQSKLEEVSSTVNKKFDDLSNSAQQPVADRSVADRYVAHDEVRQGIQQKLQLLGDECRKMIEANQSKLDEHMSKVVSTTDEQEMHLSQLKKKTLGVQTQLDQLLKRASSKTNAMQEVFDDLLASSREQQAEDKAREARLESWKSQFNDLQRKVQQQTRAIKLPDPEPSQATRMIEEEIQGTGGLYFSSSHDTARSREMESEEIAGVAQKKYIGVAESLLEDDSDDEYDQRSYGGSESAVSDVELSREEYIDEIDIYPKESIEIVYG